MKPERTMWLIPRCAHCGKRMSYHRHYFMIADRLWRRACKALSVQRTKLLCVPCVELGLARQLRRRDFTTCPVNDGYFGFDVTRFAP